MTYNQNVVMKSFISKFVSMDFFKDIINVFLYPSDFAGAVGYTDQSSIPKYLKRFFYDLSKQAKQYSIDTNKTEKFINIAESVLTARGNGQGIVTYETVNQHILANDAVVKKLIGSAIDERINTDDDFRIKLNNILLNINYYYDFTEHVLAGMTEIHEVLEKLDKPETTIVEFVEKYKEMALQLNADISQLKTVDRDETATDYYLLSDESSISKISTSITDYINDNYSFYQCGLTAYDESVSGFESSSVHLVASPSNGGKSMTLANLFYRLAQENKDEFTEHDAALYISCEDDLIKTIRKFMSIFGNYDYNIIREMYRKTHEFFNEIKKDGNPSNLDKGKEVINGLFNEILNESIVKTTKGNLKIIFKYAPENTLSAGDITKQIEKYKHSGINIKYLIIDYLDVMKPTLLSLSNIDEYNTLGMNVIVP